MNPFSEMPVSRRAILKAAGISIALAGLESVAGANDPAIPVNPRSGKEPMRIICMISNLGVHPEAFFPANYGRDYPLSPTLSPIEPIRNEVTVFSNMEHTQISSGHGAIPSTLNGVPRGSGAAVTMDQVAADAVSYTTRFPSLHMSVGGQLGCSWTKSGIKVREDDVKNIFQKLFVANQEQANKEREMQLQEQGSILDLIRKQALEFKKEISKTDQIKLEEYLSSIRDAELKLQGERKWLRVKKEDFENPAEGHPHSDTDYNFYSPLMIDLMILAIKSDSSRVFTAGYGMHNKVIEFDGVNNGYHNLSHHGRDPDRVRQLKIIDKFYFDQFARLVQKLKGSKTISGTLLDSTMVLFVSSMADASRHSNRKLPVVMSGGGFRHGEHINCESNGQPTPLNNLYTTVLQRFGVSIEKFSNATNAFDLRRP